MLKLQVLVATMNQTDFSKIDEMRIKSDVCFANQANTTRYEEIEYEDYKAEMITTNTRGVGKNRNIALTYAEGEVILFADDDIEYVDGYVELVKKAFEELPQADAIVFNINTIGGQFKRRINEKAHRVYFYNALNYGAVRIAVKRNSIQRNGIFFNTNFGGGTLYSAGEDTLFICEMLRKKLKIYTYPQIIANVNQTTSTWFTGYNKKFFYDKGALFNAISSKGTILLCLQYLIRHSKLYKEARLSFLGAFRLMLRGANGYKSLLVYTD